MAVRAQEAQQRERPRGTRATPDRGASIQTNTYRLAETSGQCRLLLLQQVSSWCRHGAAARRRRRCRCRCPPGRRIASVFAHPGCDLSTVPAFCSNLPPHLLNRQRLSHAVTTHHCAVFNLFYFHVRHFPVSQIPVRLFPALHFQRTSDSFCKIRHRLVRGI